MNLTATEYAVLYELVALARWILSDTLLRTGDDLKLEMRKPESTERSGVGTVWGHDRDGGALVQADVEWVVPVAGLLSAKEAAHGAPEGSEENSLAQVCGAS